MQNTFQPEISDATFNLLVYQTIEYILSKKIDKKKQREEIEEIGRQLGEKVMNNLLNFDQSAGYIRSSNEIENILRFIGNRLFNYIFGINEAKDGWNLERSKDGNLTYSCTFGDIRLFSFLVQNKHNIRNDKTDAVLLFIAGVIKGAIKVFNFDSAIHPSASVHSPQNSKLKIPALYTLRFDINIINYNNAQEILERERKKEVSK